MRRKTLLMFLCLEAIVCVIVGIWGGDLAISYRTIAAFPFEPIGQGLRFLSESGVLGNVLAITLYIVICLAPILYSFLTTTRRIPPPEDALLVLLSILSFVFLYRFVNPASIPSVLPAMFGNVFGKALMGQMIYSVMLTYILLKFLRHTYTSDRKILQKYLVIFLGALAILFVYQAAGNDFSQFTDGLRNQSSTPNFLDVSLTVNQSSSVNGLLSVVISFVGLLVRSVSSLSSVIIIFSVLELLENLEKGRYSEETVRMAQYMSNLCGVLLAITILSSLVYNLLQYLLANHLQNLTMNMDIPLLPIIFLLAILFATQLLRDNRKLQEDNSLFI